jgi:hypothetical protein
MTFDQLRAIDPLWFPEQSSAELVLNPIYSPWNIRHRATIARIRVT